MINLRNKGRASKLLGLACLLGTAGAAHADSVTFSGSSSGRAASAQFATSGSNLIVTLTNTAGATTPDASYVLTGVFFKMTPSTALTGVSAEIASGSTLAQPGQSDVAPTDTDSDGLLDIGA